MIVNSPGGDGAVAEKLIELCRAYCKTFRVLIPNRAKSAATIITLGADEILMGYCSEIGPIDAQVPVVVGGIPRYISAQSFINARAILEKKFQERISAKQDPRDVLQQLASLDLPFIDHCEKLMDFSREVAKKNLEDHMFAGISNARKKAGMVKNVLKELSSTDIFKIHGRMINGDAAKNRLKLNVKLLPKDSSLWKALWTYYIRAEVTLSGVHTGVPLTKMIESHSECLIFGSPKT